MDRQTSGKLGERIATDYLKDRGYEIIGRNFRTRYGEIDIIARDGNMLVFVEVRSHGSVRFGTPAESITRDKQNKLRLMSAYFLLKNKLQHEPHRIDAVSIIFDQGEAKLQHLKNVITQP